MRARWQAALATFATLVLARVTPSFADEPLPRPPPEAGQRVKVPDTTTPTAAPTDAASVEDDRPHTSYWESGETRAFAATTIDAGYLYLRPRLSLGYGKPFSKWVGIDVNPIATNRYIAGYGGLRFALPFVDLRVGGRYVWALQQSYLKPIARYHRLDIESQDLGRSKYVSLEAELTFGLPLGPGTVIGVATGSYITGGPDGAYIYDENLRVILDPPTVWRGRLGYAVRLGDEGKVSFGVVADVLGIPGRSDYVLRAGVVGSAVLSDHWEVLGSFIPPLISPDSIGILGGDFAQLGVRYRWATGSPPEVTREEWQ
jgi:hypothetical protein